MSSLPLRLRLLLLLAAIFGFLALASFGEGLAQSPRLPRGIHAAETAALPHPPPTASTLSAHIEDGAYTVDGLVAELHLNYEVQDASYMYLFVPGIGTAVVSATPRADVLQTPVTLDGDEMRFTAGQHAFCVSGIHIQTGDGTRPATLYAYLDDTAWRLARRALLGFGMTAEQPYARPGALAAAHRRPFGKGSPVPTTLLPASAPASPHPQPAPAQMGPVALHPAAAQ